jgi:hypothetical protein
MFSSLSLSLSLSPACVLWCRSRAEAKHLSKPPAKRVNHRKLGIASPFRPPFGELVALATDSASRTDAARKNQPPALVVNRCAHPQPALPLVGDAPTNVSLAVHPGQLVAVVVCMSSRGEPLANALICAPPSSQQPAASTHPRGGSEQITWSRNNALPILGYVVSGGFSYARANGAGIGFCEAGALSTLLVRGRVPSGSGGGSSSRSSTSSKSTSSRRIPKCARVFIRNTNSNLYREATVHLL